MQALVGLALQQDAKRTEEIERAGYRVIRFNNGYVLNNRDGGVAEMILEALRTSPLPEKEKARLVVEEFVDETFFARPPHPDPLPCGEREIGDRE